jgi:hypothetical protein
MSTNEIPASESDARFREATRKLIHGAKHEIRIITGEISAYRFPELREAALNALERGVKVEVYANTPDDDVANELKSAGATVTIGKLAAANHYIVSDGSHVIESIKERFREGPTRIGSRKGSLTENNKDLAHVVTVYYNFLELTVKTTSLSKISAFLSENMERCPALFHMIDLSDNLLELAGVDSKERRNFNSELPSMLKSSLDVASENRLTTAAVRALTNEAALTTFFLKSGS